jgi:leader peptidase (prepilin peptidase) / N-methyltransferase
LSFGEITLLLTSAQYLTAIQTWLAFILGAIIGSFLNVCIVRIPKGTFLSNARSFCPQCSKPIPFYNNIPILSYLVLRGRTACCAKRLPIEYLVVEVLTALFFAGFYLKHPFAGFGTDITAIDHDLLIRFVHGIVFTSLLIVCSFIDLHHMIIPDVISLPMVALSPVVAFIHPDLDWISSSLGVLAGGGILYGVAWLYWITRKEVGMGLGDVKLLAAIGGWLGYQSVLPTILFGSICGSLVGIGVMVIQRKLNMKSSIPFGPFLAFGALLHLLTNGSILRTIAGQ